MNVCDLLVQVTGIHKCLAWMNLEREKENTLEGFALCLKI